MNMTALDLESHSYCFFDFLEAHDGNTATDPGIGDKMCGSLAGLPATGRDSAVRM